MEEHGRTWYCRCNRTTYSATQFVRKKKPSQNWYHFLPGPSRTHISYRTSKIWRILSVKPSDRNKLGCNCQCRQSMPDNRGIIWMFTSKQSCQLSFASEVYEAEWKFPDALPNMCWFIDMACFFRSCLACAFRRWLHFCCHTLVISFRLVWVS